MCLGIPMKIASIDGIAAEAKGDEGTALIDLSLTPEARAGDWVLTHLGHARSVISAPEALLISEALRGLRAVMQGGSAGDAFADLDNREPALPPHLEAARRAGRTTA